MCNAHHQRLRLTGQIGSVEILPKGTFVVTLSGPDHPFWRGDDVGYDGVHQRLANSRGRASTYHCEHCHAPAAHWAWNQQITTATRTEERRNLRYSVNPDDYIPLCVTCHARFDQKGRMSDRGM